MKFPRNARIFRGQLDAAPFAAVFFLLVVFVLMGTLLYSPGIQVKLPSSENLQLAGTDQPTVSVAMTTKAIYYENQQVSETELSNRLYAAKQKISGPLTLVVQSDKDVTEEQTMHLIVIAHGAGIYDLLLATLPRVFDTTAGAQSRP